jgi:hypothetical protein
MNQGRVSEKRPLVIVSDQTNRIGRTHLGVHDAHMGGHYSLFDREFPN